MEDQEFGDYYLLWVKPIDKSLKPQTPFSLGKLAIS